MTPKRQLLTTLLFACLAELTIVITFLFVTLRSKDIRFYSLSRLLFGTQAGRGGRKKS